MSDRCRIADITEQIRGVSYKPNDLHKELDENSVILLRANNIDDGSINFDDILYVDTSKVSKNQFLQKGDILICASSGSKHLVGKAAQVDFEGNYTFGAFCKVIRPIGISPEYVGLFFQSPNYRKKISDLAQGANINNIKNEHIDNLLLNIPSANRIKEITDILQRVSKIILYRKQQLQQLDNLIKARFVEMFGDITINDRGWDSQPLGELCTIVRGGSPRPIEKYLGGDVPWIKIGDATEGEDIYLNSTKEHIIQEGVKKSRLVKKGSLIFANCGVSLGFARIITFDGCIHDGWLALENIDKRLDKVFLLQALNQMTDHFRSIAPSGTQPNLNTAIMKAYKQIIPPLEMQSSFISFITQIDKSKSVVQKALDETQLLFDSLMQQYFG